MKRAQTVKQLRDSGYAPRTVKQEMRANMIRAIEGDEPRFPGIVGYDKTALPQIENAILSGHDFILLGLRGQAKTRILRSLYRFLDEWIPAIDGCEIHDDPLRPDLPGLPAAHRRAGRRGAGHLAPARGALPREARDARRHDRRPDRRHRPDQGRQQEALLQRPRGHALRDHSADQPRHLRDQRAPRPPAANPGGALEHPRGEGHPDPRISRSGSRSISRSSSRPTRRTTRTAGTSSRRSATGSRRRS